MHGISSILLREPHASRQPLLPSTGHRGELAVDPVLASSASAVQPLTGDPSQRLRRRAAMILWISSALYVVGLFGAAIPDPAWYSSLRELGSVCRSPVRTERSRCGAPDIGPLKDALDPARTKLPAWSSERARIADDCALSFQRQCALQRLFAEPAAQAFTDARRLLDEERKRYAALSDREQGLTLGGYHLVPRIALGLIDLIAAWLIVRGLLSTGRQIITAHHADIMARQRSGLCAFITIGVLVAFATLYLGVDSSHKLAVGSDSHVVSPLAWYLTLVSMIGIVMMFGVPATLFWLMSSSDFVPRQVYPLSPDGQCGVGDYVSFAHLWTILAFVVGIGLGIGWIRYMSSGSATFASYYLIPFAAGDLLVATLAGRLVHNAMLLRGYYRASIRRLAGTWSDVAALKPAPDPTIPFIGENWWKLPATAGALVVAIWQVLEWTGASRVILDVVNR